MYRCESWIVKKTESQGIDVFKLWCWKRLLRVSWTARRSNQSILKEINSECSLGGQMLKPKLQCFSLLMQSQLIGKDPDDGKDWGQEEKGETEDEMVGLHHQINRHESEQIPGDGKGQGSLACCSPWGCKDSNMTQQLNNNNYCHNSGSGYKPGSLPLDLKRCK